MRLAKIINFRGGKPSLLMAGAILTTIASPVFLSADRALAVTFSNFSFGSGTPFGGTTVVDGVTVTLTSTNTEPFGSTSFRDTPADATPANVTFSFSQNITEFYLDVSRLLAGTSVQEYLKSFNVGTPTSLSGDLILSGSDVTTNNTNDFGAGRISFTNLNTNTISFTIEAPGALAVDQFGITKATVPEPLTILGAGTAISFGASFKRKLAKKNSKKTYDS